MSASDVSWDSFVLLLIDVQRDFWTDEIDEAFPDFRSNVQGLLELCRNTGIDVVHLRAQFQPDMSDWMVKYRPMGRIPCIEGTPGAEIFPEAEAAPGEKVIHKQTFDAFLKPDLESFLRENQKKFLLVAGLVTSVCVLLTAAAAAQRGYLLAVVEDCCADLPEAHEHTLKRYPFVFAKTTVDRITKSQAGWISDLADIEGKGND